jgi:hypothetical protein
MYESPDKVIDKVILAHKNWKIWELCKKISTFDSLRMFRVPN